MLTKPGQVIRIHDHDKSKVEVQFPSGLEMVTNMLPQLKIGDYIIANDGIIIEILTERQAEKKLRDFK